MNQPVFIKTRLVLFILVLLNCLAGCSGTKYQGYADQYKFSSQSAAPDYSNPDYWAAHPWKKDPSDSLPKALRKEKRDSLADVFFIYPTTYTEVRAGWNA